MNSIRIQLDRMGYNPIYVSIISPEITGQDWHITFQVQGLEVGMSLKHFKSIATMVMAFNPELQ